MDYYNNKHRKQKLAGLSAVQYRLHIILLTA
ncbi:IS3 family transposase [Peribacillus frigoritolerans]